MQCILWNVLNLYVRSMCNNNECVFPMCIVKKLQISISKQFYRWNFIDDNIMHFEIILCAFCRNYGSNGSQALKRNTPLIQRLTSARKKHTICVLLPLPYDGATVCFVPTFRIELYKKVSYIITHQHQHSYLVLHGQSSSTFCLSLSSVWVVAMDKLLHLTRGLGQFSLRRAGFHQTYCNLQTCLSCPPLPRCFFFLKELCGVLAHHMVYSLPCLFSLSVWKTCP